MVSDLLINPGVNKSLTIDVYDGIWSIRSIPDFKGIGGSINQVNVDTVKTKAFNDTVWRNPPQANLTKYRTNPKTFYKSANLNFWDGCRSSSGNVDSAMCNMQTDEYGYQCDAAMELDDTPPPKDRPWPLWDTPPIEGFNFRD